MHSPTPLRVGLVNTSRSRGGAARAVVTLLRSFESPGVPVQPFLFHADDSEITPPVFGLKRPGARYRNALLFRLFGERGVFDGGIAREIARRVRDLDVVHLHNLHGYYLDFSTLLRETRHMPTVWTWHDTWGSTGRCGSSMTCERWRTGCGHCPALGRYPAAWIDWSARDYKLKTQTLIRRDGIQIISPSRWLADIAIARGVPREQVHCIPNALDLDAFEVRDKHAARTSLGLDLGSFYLLFVAADCNDPVKGFDDFVEVVTSLKVKGIAVGAAPMRSTPDIVSAGTVGSKAQLALYYSACDAFVMPSLGDNYPNTVIEALACGRPVFAYPTGGIPEQMPPFWDGIAESRDARSLEKIIRPWLERAEELSALSAKVRRFAVDTWGPGTVVARHLEVYRLAMETARPSHRDDSGKP